MLFFEHCGEPFIGGTAVVHQQNAALAPLLRDRLPLRALDADLARRRRAHPQFVGHHLQARQRTHARNQCDVRDRLGEKVIGTGLQTRDPVRRLIERRHHHDGNVVRRRIALELAADFEPVETRHHHVEQHDVAFGAFAGRQRLGAAIGGRHVEILGGQPRLEQLHVRGNIVNDKDSCGHENFSF